VRTFLRLKHQLSRRLPPEFRDEELRFPEELAATALRRWSRVGDTVLDPFAGYGTTLVVAEALGRVGYGIEADARRVEYARSLLDDPTRMMHGDARRMRVLGLPPIDVVLTSPPFMARSDTFNPLSGSPAPPDTYAAYLRDLQVVFAQVRSLMRPKARAVLEVANLNEPAGLTTLAWDVARALSDVLHFEGEIVIGWDRSAYGYDHSYLLLFRP
jgi:tRNA G10  N-methylase Trm11